MSMRVDAAQIQSVAGGRLDAAQSVFFSRQLEEIDGQMYDVKYADLEIFELVSAKPLDPGTETYTYRQYDGRGIAVMTSNYASGSPRADVSGTEFTSKVRGIRASHGINIQEIRAAAKEKIPLDSMKAIQARRAINEKVNSTGLLGDSEHGIIGLFNQPNAQTYTVPAGVSTYTDWPRKTAAEILEDLFGIVDQVPTVTKEVEGHQKNKVRLLLPYTRLRLIGRLNLKLENSSNITVLKYFQEQRPNVEVRGALFLDTAGASSSMRMVCYDPRREYVEFILPIAYENFAPQMQGMEFVTEHHARCGGVVNRYPLAMIYGDGI